MNTVVETEAQRQDFEARRPALVMALKRGDVREARLLMDKILSGHPCHAATEEWTQFNDVDSWLDEWLISAARRDPPHEAAVDALVKRYWKPLFARCQMLTLNYERANDLAQEAWL